VHFSINLLTDVMVYALYVKSIGCGNVVVPNSTLNILWLGTKIIIKHILIRLSMLV